MPAISRRLAAPLFLIALLAAGCAHQRAPAPRSEPPSAQPPPGTTTPGASSGSAGTSDGAPTGKSDPSEVITAEELATIPDPVPGGAAEAPIDPTPPARETPPSSSSPGTGTDTGWIWRVQVFASPDRVQAERTAREASERLREPYVIDHEGALYKVRLGGFAKESDAEPLKRKAVLEGYTGAFRVQVQAR
ncbi:MAG TPA: SPOR domain-containing protein [Candidatus Eisenbacteria bacterium]|nr:SPOR domain-containing protein [Candidatus Eisenbacteria bacterium]